MRNWGNKNSNNTGFVPYFGMNGTHKGKVVNNIFKKQKTAHKAVKKSVQGKEPYKSKYPQEQENGI